VPARTRFAETTEAIRRLVLDGHVRSGERIRDHELVNVLGVSRATVREAIRPLVEEGILVYEPFKGMRVATFTDEQLLDLAEIRTALETLAAKRFARHREAEAEEKMLRVLEDLDTARRSKDARALNSAHVAFHRLVYRLAGVPLLEQMWRVIDVQTRLALKIDQETRPDFKRIAEGHRDLYKAIVSGQEHRIERAVRGHIARQAARVVQERHKPSSERRAGRGNAGRSLREVKGS
jgi:DNA-binding GntR family transcriptional regulator